jgi:oligopeptide transport system ATP-binding protein
MSEQILSIQDLSVIYKTDLETVYAVNHISLDLNAGETLGLVGETGAGKTTTALGVMGLLPERTARVTSGRILLQGDDLLKKKELEMQRVRGEKISMIFQDPMTALNPVLTVEDQIGEALYLHNAEELTAAQISKRVEAILEQVGIPRERKKEYPYQFSGGMRQRAMIAMALICEPKLLIADEPTTALDVTIQAQILELMKDLQKKENTSIIFITHNLGVVAEICDRVSVMYAGRIVEQGLVQDIFYRPQHPYTKGLIASTPRLDEEDQERLVPIEGTPIDLLNPPSGCNFGPRCKNCMKICLREKPPYAQVGEGHISACWLHFMNRGSREAADTGKENTANE